MNEKLWIMIVMTLLVLAPVFSATNGHLSFQIYIDNVTPHYTNYEGIASINNINDEFYCYAKWSDEGAMKNFVFEWDKDGAFTNDSSQPMVDDWSNVSKTFTSIDEGKTINYRLHGFDKMNNLNSTYIKQLVIASLPPEFSDVGQDNNSPLIGDSVHITSYWIDNFEIDHVYLQTNETGDWLDNGSPVNIDLSEGWANFTIDTTGMNTSPYFWRLTGFDEIGNSNNTPINYFTPQES